MIQRKDFEHLQAAADIAIELEKRISDMHKNTSDPLLAEIAMDILSIFRPEVSDRLMRLSRHLKPLVRPIE